MRLDAYLFFDGTCREAFDFYAAVTGGTLTNVMTYDQMPGEMPAMPHMIGKIANARLDLDGYALMGSDAPGGTKPPAGFAISLEVDTHARADEVFAALAEGGSVSMPLSQTFWASRFGMLVDRYGVSWMVTCP